MPVDEEKDEKDAAGDDKPASEATVAAEEQDKEKTESKSNDKEEMETDEETDKKEKTVAGTDSSKKAGEKRKSSTLVKSSLSKVAAPPAMEQESTNGPSEADIPAPKTGVKRKLGEEEVVEDGEDKDNSSSPQAEKVKVNGTSSLAEQVSPPTQAVGETKVEKAAAAAVEDEEAMEVEEETPAPTVAPPVQESTADADTLEDSFVLVNKEDVPAPNSKEVSASLPPAHVEQPKADSKGANAQAPPAFTLPVVVPLTEAEVAKIYAKEQVGSRIISTTVEPPY